MILIDGKEYRNLTEQVLKNKQDIANHYNIDRVLADFGIKIIGTVSTPEAIPMDRTYEYGDAYAVGSEPPYDYYIWTRANESAGQPNDYFLNIGSISIVGPQGPQGPKGDKGNTGESSKWYAAPNAPSGAKENDMWLNTNTGIVSQYSSGTWIQKTNIQGPQGIQGNTGPEGPQGPRGPQGIQGETGVPGNAIQYVDILSDISQLPDPTTVPRNSAYIIQETDGNYTYFITGTTELIWNRVPFENGSLVIIGGNPVQIFDADTKLDKATTSSYRARVYCTAPNGTNTVLRDIASGTELENGRIPIYIWNSSTYGETGTGDAVLVSGEPLMKRHVATKNYVDNSHMVKFNWAEEPTLIPEYGYMRKAEFFYTDGGLPFVVLGDGTRIDYVLGFTVINWINEIDIAGSIYYKASDGTVKVYNGSVVNATLNTSSDCAVWKDYKMQQPSN